MSRKGNCWDNAVAESFPHTLKGQYTNHSIFKDQLRSACSVILKPIVITAGDIQVTAINHLQITEKKWKQRLKLFNYDSIKTGYDQFITLQRSRLVAKLIGKRLILAR